jgi:hypothetical protein
VIVLTAKDLTAEDRRRLHGHVKRIMAKGEGIQSVLKKVQELVAQCVVAARADPELGSLPHPQEPAIHS